MKPPCILPLCLLFSHCLFAQDKPLIQFSGVLISADSMAGIPFAHIAIKGSHRVAMTRVDGYFSLPASDGDTLLFTSIGYSSSYYVVTATDTDDQVAVIEMMSRRDYSLPPVTVYPWGDKKNFKDEFLHTKVPKDMHAQAESNIRSALINPHEPVLIDGRETGEHYMKALAQQYAYGKMQPNAPNIINPLAWMELIKAIGRGDFKKKKTEKPEEIEK